jgi:hypothetical protein
MQTKSSAGKAELLLLSNTSNQISDNKKSTGINPMLLSLQRYVNVFTAAETLDYPDFYH